MRRFLSVSRGYCFALLVSLSLALNTGCTYLRPAPLDLHTVHERLVDYHENGEYLEDVARAARPAIKYLEKRADPDQKLAILLDIDETALSNWPQLFAAEFCYDPAVWNTWVMKAEAEALDPILAIYKRARELGYAVFLLSGRAESQREATDANLRAIGYTDFEELILKPAGTVVNSAVEYKAPVRQRIESQGWTIVLNVGDQQSDLDGGFAEKTIKLPNPFYFIE